LTTAGQAYWNSRFPGQVLVVTDAGSYPLRVAPPRDLVTGRPLGRPSPVMLAGTGWHVFPGGEWLQDGEDGEWATGVFRLPAQAEASSR
jgi:hypothetical protein